MGTIMLASSRYLWGWTVGKPMHAQHVASSCRMQAAITGVLALRPGFCHGVVVILGIQGHPHGWLSLLPKCLVWWRLSPSSLRWGTMKSRGWRGWLRVPHKPSNTWPDGTPVSYHWAWSVTQCGKLSQLMALFFALHQGAKSVWLPFRQISSSNIH